MARRVTVSDSGMIAVAEWTPAGATVFGYSPNGDELVEAGGNWSPDGADGWMATVAPNRGETGRHWEPWEGALPPLTYVDALVERVLERAEAVSEPPTLPWDVTLTLEVQGVTVEDAIEAFRLRLREGPPWVLTVAPAIEGLAFPCRVAKDGSVAMIGDDREVEE